MDYYLTSMRSAADHSRPEELKPVLDFLMELAKEDYKAGALDEIEIWDILNEYTDLLMTNNSINYH